MRHSVLKIVVLSVSLMLRVAHELILLLLGSVLVCLLCMLLVNQEAQKHQLLCPKKWKELAISAGLWHSMWHRAQHCCVSYSSGFRRTANVPCFLLDEELARSVRSVRCCSVTCADFGLR